MSEVVDPRAPVKKAADPAPAAPVVPPPPTELVLKRHGKELKVPVEKAVELAQKGLDYDKRMEDLNRQRAALGSDTEQYQNFQTLKQRLAENPKLAKAVQLALEDPDAVLSPTPRNGAQDDGLGLDDEPATSSRKTERRPPPELAELRNELTKVQATQQQMAARDADIALNARLDVELSAYPELQSRPRALAAAKREAIRAVREQGLAVEHAASQAAADIRELLEDSGRERVTEARRPVAPVAGPAPGIPATFEAPKVDRHLKPGKLGQIAADVARGFGFLPPKR